MPTKRRNHGRNKKGRGNVTRVRCTVTGKAIPKDKAIRKMKITKLVGDACERDIQEHSVFTSAANGMEFGNSSFMPKIFVKEYYCIEAAVHKKFVKVRSRTMRRVRERITKIEGSKAGKSTKLNIGAITKKRTHHYY
jgi:small subunit ribosomal protein S26e